MIHDEHVDEGTIHAWLDGALEPDAAARVAAHVESCASCRTQVAEAHGLIAGASRVVGLLDDAPATTGPRWGTGADAAGAARRPARDATSAWRRLRITPARAAIAATLLVAVGVTLTYDRTANESTVRLSTPADSVAVAATNAPAKVASGRVAGTVATTPPSDTLLRSAVKRNIAAAQPQRTIEAARTPAPLTAPVPVASAVRLDSAAPLRVAAGRAAVAQARIDSSAAVADRARADAVASPTSPAPARDIAAAKAAIAGGVSAREARRSRVETATSIPVPAECYRVDGAAGSPVIWGTVEAPFVVALNASGGGARVLTADGVDTGTGATWNRGAGDSVTIQLRRPGLQGTLELGAPGDVRAGVMRSSPLPAKAAPAVPIIATRTDCPSR